MVLGLAESGLRSRDYYRCSQSGVFAKLLQRDSPAAAAVASSPAAFVVSRLYSTGIQKSWTFSVTLPKTLFYGDAKVMDVFGWLA